LVGGGILMDVLSIPAFVKSSLLALHLLGIVFGLGAASMLDLIIVRFIGSRTVTHEYWSVISLASKAVTGGLVLLWISGVGFLIHYTFFNPTLLMNPKVWAKILIVGVLSLNGVFIHRVVLPLVRQQVGGPLFEGLTDFQRSCLLASGVVSGISWWIPLGLGAFPQLNFTVGAGTILLAYALLLSLVIVVASFIVRLVLPQQAKVTLSRAEYYGLVNRLSALQQYADAVSARMSTPPGAMNPGPTTGWANSTQPSSRPIKRRSTARAEWLRVAVPAVLALVVVGLAFVFVPPANQGSRATDRPGETTGFELASAAGAVAPAPSAMTTFNAAAPVYEPPQYIAEPQFSNEPSARSPSPAIQEDDRDRIPVRQAPAKVAYVGIWGANANVCSAKTPSVSNPLAIISDDGATAGDISCAFDNMKFDGSSWQTVAKCTDGREHWRSAVRLAVKNDRLTWTSRRGSESYQRCDRAVSVTTAQPAKPQGNSSFPAIGRIMQEVSSFAKNFP
jgi:hypothetical protein